MLDTYFSKLNLLKLNFILQHFKTILNTNTNPIIANFLFDFSKCLPFVRVLKMQFSNLFGWVAEWVAALVHVLVGLESVGICIPISLLPAASITTAEARGTPLSFPDSGLIVTCNVALIHRIVFFCLV